ncbi:MAG: hypothetical protein KME15_22810 [Drouetiella hepatica Uher 2000/2452]|uniref:Uncharacterized protein n=1 Tax=Drouetiella hepatica Uher 2000/2452 TaxID=904376 RepID=A0A951QF06_9CYAN|nr:hypothetical protein [Drouetiella hepatica Uher 2000/2452]
MPNSAMYPDRPIAHSSNSSPTRSPPPQFDRPLSHPIVTTQHSIAELTMPLRPHTMRSQLLQFDCEPMQCYCSRYNAIATRHNAIANVRYAKKPLGKLSRLVG